MKSEFNYEIDGEIKTVTVEGDGDRFQVTVEARVYDVVARQPEPGQLDLEVDGQRLRAYVAHNGARRYVAMAGGVWLLERSQAQRQRRGPGPRGAAGSGGLEATMPGLVLEVLVAEGDPVARGDTLVLLEAMKMETRVTAPCAGQVRQVHCAAGQVVERGQMLVEIEEE